jgi:hypothetical protein
MAESGDEFPPERLAAVFKHFVLDVANSAHGAAGLLLQRITDHLGGNPSLFPSIAEDFETFEHPNVQLALDAYLARSGRSFELVGVSAENKRFMELGFSDLISRGSPHGFAPVGEGPVDYVNVHLAGDRVIACVQFGLYFIKEGDRRLLALVTGPGEHSSRQRLRVEVMTSRPEDAQNFHAEVKRLAQEVNVYRGHVISLSPGRIGPWQQPLVEFHSLPKVTRNDVVLPADLLERIERHTIGFAQRSAELLASGRSLKRGLLLYGLPGTGKTLTVMYLAGQMKDRTVILTTGRAMGLVPVVAKMARSLAPSMVVLEDVDLIAEERGQPMMPTGPLLFELLNEMDGLRDDLDVIFVLTTNRPDILEPALAARPGRIDLAVELPLPDAAGRHRLLELYARGLTLRDVHLETFVESTEGVSPAYIKELLRKAALLAASAGRGAVVTDKDLSDAMEELSKGGELAERILGYRPQAGVPERHRAFPFPPTGFPTTITRVIPSE